MCKKSSQKRDDLVKRQKKLGPPPTALQLITSDRVPDPNRIVDRLLMDSEPYQALFSRAEKAVQEHLGSDISFVTHKKGGPAYYDQDIGQISILSTGDAPTGFLNVIFETANACQAGNFAAVERDWKADVVFDESSYEKFGFSADDVPHHSSHDGSSAFHCAMIREMMEWNTFLIAKDAFRDIEQHFGSGHAKDVWDMSFGQILGFADFGEYYQEKGRLHRNTVQTNLQFAKQREKEKKK